MRLVEISYVNPWMEGMLTVHKGSDLFAAQGPRLSSVPPEAQLVSATFKAWFKESRDWGTVTVTPPDEVECMQDGDVAAVEAWLARRGFMMASRLGEVSHDGERAESVLADA